MKIATWNVNSVRIRLDKIIDWLQVNPVDILCLQETKVIDANFPETDFTAIGYHAYYSGQKSYNGVAILSRVPLTEVSTGFIPLLGANKVEHFDEQKRLITGKIDDIQIICVYVPNGSEIGSDKYLYKLQWLKFLQEYLQISLQTNSRLCICGDFNIAPEDRDVYDPVKCEGIVGVSPVERQALQNIMQLGLADPFRKFTSEGEYFSWWDYRQGSFRQNRGWRIDHHYLSLPLYEQAISCTIDLAPRRLKQPSDHTPVIVEIIRN